MDVENTFSVDDKFYPRPWGVHKPWRKFAQGPQHDELLKNCPEMELFREHFEKQRKKWRRKMNKKKKNKKSTIGDADTPTEHPQK